MPICLSPDYKKFLDFLIKLQKEKGGYKIKEALFAIFNDFNTWLTLLLDKYGKNVVEHLITTFSEETTGNYDSSASSPSVSTKTLSFELLGKVINENIVELCKGKFSTYAIQVFIQATKYESTATAILNNLTDIAACRNGVFAIISALNSYKEATLHMLLDKIIYFSEVFSKNNYSSTLIEFVLKTFTDYCVPKFIESKSIYFLGKFLIYNIQI